MGFLDRFHKKSAPKASTKKFDVADKKEIKPVAEKAELKALAVPAGNELSFRLLKKPHVSEKAARLSEKQTYVFDVALNAEKVAIKKAVESLYKVKVISVRTIRHAGKPVYRGRYPGARNAWKKALVTLAKGQTINLYEAV